MVLDGISVHVTACGIYGLKVKQEDGGVVEGKSNVVPLTRMTSNAGRTLSADIRGVFTILFVLILSLLV